MSALVPGRYFDGRSATPHIVRVEFTRLGLRIVDADGRPLSRWALTDVRVLEDPDDGRPAVYTLDSDPQARLQIEDLAFHRNLILYAPLSAPGRARLSLSLPALAGWAAAAAVVIVIVAWTFPRLSGPVAQIIPDAWREDIGEKVVTMMGSGRKDCRQGEGLAALEGLTQRLQAVSPRPTDRIRVRVFSGGPVNAFAAPGGEVVLFEDLITKADEADEVAGVLAHEIGHAIHRHPTEGVVNAIGLSLVVQFMFGGLQSDAITGAATQMYTSGYGRDAEREADQTGAEMLRRAGISPRGMVTFFERILDTYGDSDSMINRYLGSHPSLIERIDSLSEQAAFSGRPALDAAQWEALRGICNPDPASEAENSP